MTDNNQKKAVIDAKVGGLLPDRTPKRTYPSYKGGYGGYSGGHGGFGGYDDDLFPSTSSYSSSSRFKPYVSRFVDMNVEPEIDDKHVMDVKPMIKSAGKRVQAMFCTAYRYDLDEETETVTMDESVLLDQADAMHQVIGTMLDAANMQWSPEASAEFKAMIEEKLRSMTADGSLVETKTMRRLKYLD